MAARREAPRAMSGSGLAQPQHQLAAVRVLGVSILDEPPQLMASRAVRDFLASGERTTVLAMHITALNAIDTPGLRQALGSADYLHADGGSVALIAKLAGARELTALPTTDLGPQFLTDFARFAGRPARIAIIGGEPGIADDAIAALAADCGAEAVFASHGYHGDWSPVLEALGRSRPDVVFVGLGMPLEALWVQQWRHQLPPAMIITCGGWLRLLAGAEQRAPAWLVGMHLEFAWRWVTDFSRTNERYSRGLVTVAKGAAVALRDRRRARE